MLRIKLVLYQQFVSLKVSLNKLIPLTVRQAFMPVGYKCPEGTEFIEGRNQRFLNIT